MSVGSICRRPACTATRDQTVLEVARQMGRDRVGSLVVTEEGRPVGVVTDRDVALQILTAERDPAATTVMEIAATPVVSLREELPVSQASDRMRTHGLRRVPVIDAEEKVVGMVSADDLLRLISEELTALADVAAEQVPAGVRQKVQRPGWLRAVSHYAKDVVTAGSGEPVRDVAQRMRSSDVGCVVVLNEDKSPCGMVTDRNLTLRVVAKGLDPDATPVSQVMTPSVVHVDGGARLQDVARVMSDQGIRRVPVMRGDKLCGIVSYDDLLVALGRELHDLGQAARGSIARERQ
jgi:CBS domain-containing protein